MNSRPSGLAIRQLLHQMKSLPLPAGHTVEVFIDIKIRIEKDLFVSIHPKKI